MPRSGRFRRHVIPPPLCNERTLFGELEDTRVPVTGWIIWDALGVDEKTAGAVARLVELRRRGSSLSVLRGCARSLRRVWTTTRWR